jgi:hypothetical protein
MIHTREFFSEYADKINCGENIFGQTSGPPFEKVNDGAIPSKTWYDENADYDWNNPGKPKSPDKKIGKIHMSR